MSALALKRQRIALIVLAAIIIATTVLVAVWQSTRRAELAEWKAIQDRTQQQLDQADRQRQMLGRTPTPLRPPPEDEEEFTREPGRPYEPHEPRRFEQMRQYEGRDSREEFKLPSVPRHEPDAVDTRPRGQTD